MNIAWLTDVPLNFLKAEAKDGCEILQEFSTDTNKPIYFV